MKKAFLLAVTAMFCTAGFTSCLSDDDNDELTWRTQNDQYMTEMQALLDDNNNPYFTKVVPDWNPNAYVLMHWHNDRNATRKNISPISTSYVDVKYHLRTIDGLAKDSSYMRTSPADSIYRTQLNSNIEGWIIALPEMHVGDSVTMVIPYQFGYGSSQRGTIEAYSDLIFDVKLKGVPGYETKPN